MKKLHLIILTSFFITITSCYKEEDYLLSNLNDNFLVLSTNDTSILADGVSSTEIILEIPYNTKNEFSKVYFKTSNGKFENDKQEIEALVSKVVIDGKDKKIAKTKLISSQSPGKVFVEARISDLKKYTQIVFERAYPDFIKTELPSLTISYSNQTIPLTTKLTRINGKPSLMSNAKINAVDSSGKTVGQFLNYNELVNENGILINQYSLGTINCNCQIIYIITESKNSINSVIRDTTTLKIN